MSSKENNVIYLTEHLKNNGISHCFYFTSTGNIRFTTHHKSMVTVQRKQRTVYINRKTDTIWTKLIIKKHLSGNIPFFWSQNALSRAGIFKYVLDVSNKQCHYYSITNHILHSQFIIPASSTPAPNPRL
ncbi:TPA: DUF1398 family protein [Escherichia coli]|nr:DUF1398 family protein [Escherichia coli]